MNKKLLYILYLISSCFVLTAQGQNGAFSKVIYDQGNIGIKSYGILAMHDSSFIVTGNYDYYHALVMKVDSIGNTIWALKSSNTIGFTRSAADGDSAFYLAGMTNQNGNTADLLVARLNENGDTSWVRGVRFPFYSVSVSTMQASFHHGVLICGFLQSNTSPNFNGFILKMDNLGNLLWTIEIPGTSTIASQTYSVVQMPDSSIAVSGDFPDGISGNKKSMILRFNSTGNLVQSKWYKSVGATTNSITRIVAKGNHLCCFMKTDFGSDLFELDSLGTVVAAMRYFDDFTTGFPEFEPTHLMSDRARGYYVSAGDLFGIGKLMHVDSAFHVQYLDYLEFMHSNAVLSPDKGVVLTGNGPLLGVRVNSPGDDQIGLIKVDSTGNGLFCVNNTQASFLIDTIISGNCSISFVPAGTVVNESLSFSSYLPFSESRCVYIWGGLNQKENGDLISIVPANYPNTYSINSERKTLKCIELYDIQGKHLHTSLLSGNTATVSLAQFAKGMLIYRLQLSDGTFKSGKLLVE